METINIKGKKYKLTSANDVIKNNTEEDLDNHFNGNGIDAIWTRHIQEIDKILKQPTEYKAGRPCKKVQEELEQEL